MDRLRAASDVDPLTLALQPPVEETSAERTIRLRAEAEAKRVSDAIDEQLKAESNAAKKRKGKEVKILMLGQSESGKSTTIKNFQILYSPHAFHSERVTWRAVIFLNVVRSVRRILSVLADSHSNTSQFGVVSSNTNDPDVREDISSSPRTDSRTSVDKPTLPPDIHRLATRLSPPLAILEESLIKALSSSDPADDQYEATHLGLNNPLTQRPNGRVKEHFVSATQWKKALTTKLSKDGLSSLSRSRTPSEGSTGSRDPFAALYACSPDIAALWANPYVREILGRRNVRPEDASGFFLNDISRILTRAYVPSDQDVLNARIKTVGILEHYFALDRGHEKGVNWIIYDVGGARNQRHVWASFFDDVNAIIFLAPISAFNQMLTEDPEVNRVDDSLMLFQAICENKLLSKVSIVLFLNKIDILRAKIDAGVSVKKYIPSYGDRPNDTDNVCKYFRSKFGLVYRETSTNPERELYVHLTTVNDPKSTAALITNVRDMLLRKSLQNMSLL